MSPSPAMLLGLSLEVVACVVLAARVWSPLALSYWSARAAELSGAGANRSRNTRSPHGAISSAHALGWRTEAPRRRVGPPAPRVLKPRGLTLVVLLVLLATIGVATVGGSPGAAASALPSLAALTAACAVDGACHRLPNSLIVQAAAWWTTAGLVLAILGASWHALGRSLVTGFIAGAVLFLMALIRSGLGMGDVKLGALLAAWLGWLSPWLAGLALAAGFFLGGLIALGLLLTRRAGRKDHLAFGPYLLAGAWLVWALAVLA